MRSRIIPDFDCMSFEEAQALLLHSSSLCLKISRTCSFFLERKDAPGNVSKIPARLPPQHLKPNIMPMMKKKQLILSCMGRRSDPEKFMCKARQITGHLARCLTGRQQIHVEHSKATHHYKSAEQAQHDDNFSSVQQRVHRVLQTFADKE